MTYRKQIGGIRRFVSSNCLNITNLGARLFIADKAAAAVAEGDMVNSGDVIGAVGDTAQIEVALASHLHFALDRNGTWIDPVEYISPSAK